MMSFTRGSIWPLRLDITPLECRQILREKELLCYSDLVSVLRAQGPMSEEKISVLANLQKIFSISDERNKAELRRAANNEKLATIAEKVSGFDAYAEWASLGALKIPPTLRLIPRVIYLDEACQAVANNIHIEKDLPSPLDTNDLNLSEKHDEAIKSNRMVTKNSRSVKNDQNLLINCNVATNTECTNIIVKEESIASLDYNLHLLSEIATGESTQSVTAVDPFEGEIKPDTFSIHHHIDDIELHTVIPESSLLSPPRNSYINHIPVTAASSNVLASSNIKTLTNTGHDLSVVNLTGNSVPIGIGNNTVGQRYVLPRSTLSQGINLVATNEQRQPVTGFIAQQQQQSSSGAYLTLANNQMRSPPSHQISTTWTGQPQTQQVYFQNVSSHHSSLGIQQNITHQTMENLTSLGYTLQQRAVRAEQHQTGNKHNYIVRSFAEQHPTNNKQNLIVRNLGSQISQDPERNKRFMVVKGGNSLGPSTKKPKISNPSNRQPGRPPLMPAPSSTYTSRPYVANEIFNSSRTSNNATSSNTDSPSIDSNGFKIGSGNNRTMTMNSSQIRPNSYYSVSRGNSGQRTNCGSVVQLGLGSNARTIESPNVGTSITIKPKNVQPVISMVPLSPRGTIMGDSIITSNVLMTATRVKEEIIDHHITEQESIMPVRVISKDEVYANIMDRANNPSMLSLCQTENKTQ